jgi:hypothetical protein
MEKNFILKFIVKLMGFKEERRGMNLGDLYSFLKKKNFPEKQESLLFFRNNSRTDGSGSGKTVNFKEGIESGLRQT